MELCPLNVFLGLNGSGKSSFLQVIAAVLTAAARSTDKNQGFAHWFDLEEFDDLLYQFAAEDEITIQMSSDRCISLPLIATRTSFTGVVAFNEIVHEFHCLSPERLGPTLQHQNSKTSQLHSNYVGENGERAVAFLFEHGNSIKVPEKLRHPECPEDSLLAQVNAWLREVSPNARLDLTEIAVLKDVLLQYKYDLTRETTHAFKPSHVGWGLSYVLPVLTLLLASHNKGSNSKVIIIESPEAHIHPKGQAALGRLIALAASSNAQIFIETHSDHIINGIRVAAKQKLINNKDVNLSFFERKTAYSNEGVEEQFSALSRINVDRNGELDSYPSDFLDQWNIQLMELI